MQIPINIGVDVAKDHVVVASAENILPSCQVPNQRADLLTWLKTLPPGSRLGLEATGQYHEVLADLAHARGFTVFVLNPKDTRHYAKAMGTRAKTDRVDAVLIARLVAHEHQQLHPYVPPTTQQRQVSRLLKRRAKLTALKGALKQTLQGLPGFSTERKAMIAKFESLIAKIDVQLARFSEQSPENHQAKQRLQTIVGVGPLVGTSLTHYLARTSFKNADAFVAFTGFDPRPCDSGRKTGRRRLSKRGPSELRRLLFNAAMSGSKTTTWKPHYEHYRAKGWSSTAALVIIARKIARTAWSIYHYNTTFDTRRISSQLA